MAKSLIVFKVMMRKDLMSAILAMIATWVMNFTTASYYPSNKTYDKFTTRSMTTIVIMSIDFTIATKFTTTMVELGKC